MNGPSAIRTEALLAQAQAETGLTRFGDEYFVDSLRQLLQTVQADIPLNATGRVALKARLLRCLRNRLWAEQCFETHPEIKQRQIVAPIVIVGPGRSGTTRLQRMLAADPRLQHLRTWEGFNPAPRLDLPDHGRQIRREEVDALLQQGRAANPEAFAAHPQDTDWPEEEILLIHHSFCGLMALGMQRYYDWLLGHDMTDAYRYMADLMRLVSWSRNEPEEVRWVLKTPHHMLALDVLLKTFPDAKLVFTHRDPLKTVPSVMSLMWHLARQSSDLPLREPIRDVWLRLCEEMDRRSIKARESIAEDRQLDIQYEDANGDWKAVMQRVYDFAGMEFDALAMDSIGSWVAASDAENRHGGHRYALEDFALSREEVDARFRFVRETYAVPYEGRRA